jgi:hypothetical protein
MILRSLSILSILLVSATICFSQGRSQSLQGKVSFITSGNVYVKFADTKNISVGDTLRISVDNRLSPCLIVSNKSSISCVATPVNGCAVKVGDQITYQPRVSSTEITANGPDKNAETKPVKVEDQRRSDKIMGSISAAGYSVLSSTRGNDTKAMYRLSFIAPRINNSKFSVESYLNYRQSFLSTDSGNYRPKDVFNVYNLAVQFDASPTLTFVLGRKINPKVSSIGAIDGLQAEKSFGNFYTGIIAGFRPDISDYNFNPDLMQYGAYVGLKSQTKGFYSHTTLGAMEQNNSGNVDRRYTYFQHSSTIAQKLNIFSSFELDLYNQVTADSVGKPRLTNLYILVGYRISRMVDFSLSYNSRKQIVYYETLKTDIERMLDDDIARQGIRATVNIRPANYIGIGGSYSKRFQSNDLNKSDNLNGYVSFSKIPWIGGRIYANYNRNTSNYMQTNIYSVRYSRPIIKMKLDGDVYYRLVNYNYFDSETKTDQQYYGATLSYRIAKKLVFNVMGEMAATQEEDIYRVNARITKSF